MAPRRGFIQGSTMFIKAHVRQARLPYDPSSVEVVVLLDPSGVDVIDDLESTEFERSATGEWLLKVDTTELEIGQYRVIINAPIGDDDAYFESAFVVLAGAPEEGP